MSLLNGVTVPILTCATVGAAAAATQGIYYAIQGGFVSADDFQYTLNRMGEGAVFWGTVAGVSVITKYGLELVNPDSLKSYIATAVTLTVISAMEKNKYVTPMDSIVKAVICGTITGIASAAHRCATGKAGFHI